MRSIVLIVIFLFTLSSVFGQPGTPKLVISHLTGDFYIYTTYNTYEGSRVPAHGMYLVTDKGVALFDTPWDTTQFQPLLDSIKSKHKQAVTICIATHWHSDRTEGLDYFRLKGIRTYTTRLTDKLSERNGKKRAEYLMEKDTFFHIGPYSFETYYPGQGHTEDNIVIWFGREKILYGGCLIKGREAKNLGFLGDGNITEYETTLRNVDRKCPDPEYIIVSHHDWNNTNALRHSIQLAGELKRKHQ